MQTTPNLGLKKPESNEYVNVADINENADTIDLAIGKIMPLDADMTVYVATTGSDTTGDGTSGNPYETITYALSKVPKFLNGHAASVVIEAGVYLEDIMIIGFTGSLQLLIKGNITVNSISVEYSSVLINSSIAAKYTISTQWISIKNRSAYESYTNIDYNITGSLSGVITDRALSIYAATSSSVYMSGNVYLTGNTDTAIGVFSKTTVYVGGIFGSGFTRGSIVDTGSELSIGRNNLIATTDSTLNTASVVVNQFGAKIGTLQYDTTLYVSPTGSDETGTGTSVNPLKTIQRAINIVPKDLGSFVCTINVASGTYNEDVYIRGFHNGSINLYSEKQNTLSTSCNVLSIMVGHCTGYVRINGFNLISTTKVPITVFSTDGAYIYYCQCTFPTSSINGINCYESKVGVEYCKMTGKDTALMASFSTVISNNWYSSSGNNYGIYSLNGSRITMNGSQPSGINGNFIFGNGGMFVNNNGTQISDLITSGISCTWATTYGGYYRNGNLIGPAQIIIEFRVTLTTALTAGNQYYITGFPKPALTAMSAIPLSCHFVNITRHCLLDTSGNIAFIPQSNLGVGDSLLFGGTYITNS